MGTTPRGIPYPDLGDPPNGPGQMQALAEGVDPLIPRLLKGPPIQAPATGIFSAPGVVSQINVPDPGVAYRLLVSGRCFAYCDDTSRWDLQYRLDSLGGSIIYPAVTITPSASATYYKAGPDPGPSDVLTGSHVLYFVAYKISGGAGLNARFSLDPVLQAFWAMQFPA